MFFNIVFIIVLFLLLYFSIEKNGTLKYSFELNYCVIPRHTRCPSRRGHASSLRNAKFHLTNYPYFGYNLKVKTTQTSQNERPLTSNLTLEERLKVFANLIVDRIIEDQTTGRLRFKNNQQINNES